MAALKEYVARREQLGVLKLIGKIEFDPAYCYRGNRILLSCWGRFLPL